MNPQEDKYADRADPTSAPLSGEVGSETSDARAASGTSGVSDVPGASDATKDGRRWSFKPLGWVNGPSRAVALAVLVVLLVLFGRDVLSSWHLRSEIGELERRKKELYETLAADSTLLRNLDDAEFLERYARERYLMRREGETVYIIEE